VRQHCLPAWGCEVFMGYPLAHSRSSPVSQPACQRIAALELRVCSCLHGSRGVGRVHAHFFPQNVSQHGCAVPDTLSEATVLQEHGCALFPLSMKLLVQIRDFLCVCWRKAWASIIPCLPHLAWDPVLFGGLLHCLCTHPLLGYHIVG